ncbi:EAL domain-containing protein [Rhodococcus sp. BP-149]|nr:EAL domain-containing protein [Rhodococcus sp. BP-188]MBY6700622.1 EAL domain-containing protein [Rhodococcus sp. BP-285]MBY6705019.1 EAL domain-containing protein [Rhodococcus sp. BP-283]MBY6713747.1 EAL domain-containing protein [Rhodococcus sp. BP-160]MBY6715637.1 EAL domain-containing protein [Rhodococcus sp. BP-110]MBY6722093.1 EAL domain-containing protein [Rhodococcus sp. BP-142]MBY6726619.1 EAL domain-containing protein [Rhodococcus sp. BP-149]MBY6730788.1 EAL domain-containing pr
MAVNLSARQAQHVYMFVVVTDMLARHGLESSDLILELTESVLLESGSSTLRQLSQLRANGVGIAIDDFGTGYASLRHLATLPVSAVKIDRSFTATMTKDPASDSIVRAIVGMARDLRLDCVVEGIETVEQLHSLPGEVQGQGFLLGRPAPDPFDSWSAAGSAT